MKTNIIKKCFLAAAMLMPMLVSAQNGYEIYKKSGTRIVFPRGDVDSIVYKNNINPDISITDISATKGSINFKLNIAEGKTAKYDVIPDWNLQLFKLNHGFNVDEEYTYRNVLQYGIDVNSTSNITYYNGYNYEYDRFQQLMGGYRYFIVASIFSEETQTFEGDPIVEAVRLPEPGKSTNELTLKVINLSEQYADIDLKFTTGIKWLSVKCFKKADYDNMLEHEGEYHIKKEIIASGSYTLEPMMINCYVQPGTEYVVAALGSDINDDEMYATVSFKSIEKKEHLLNLNATKNEISYSIDVNEGEIYRSLYISEAEYILLCQSYVSQLPSPEDYDENDFRKVLLHSYGAQGVGPTNLRWTNTAPIGGDNWMFAILPGLKYYVLFCRYADGVPLKGSIVDRKEIVIPEPGVSPERFDFSVTFPGDGVASLKIIKPENIAIYYCGYIATENYDSFFGQLTDAQIAEVMITQGALNNANVKYDMTNMQGQAISYIIYGIDKNGDVYLQKEDFVVPM